MSSQSTQSCKIEKNLDFLGKGSFGTVTNIPGTNNVLKTMELKCYENFKELCFLSSYKNVPFISQLITQESNVKENWIKMTMKNAGNSFKDVKNKFSIEQKVEMIPEILAQFIRILIWMQQENIMHCDIKPANICIDKDLFVTLIDWGFVEKIQNKKKYWIGTKRFYDPFVRNDIKIIPRSEIFAMGFSLCNFLIDIDMHDWDYHCNIFQRRNYNDSECMKKINLELLNITCLSKIKHLFINSFGDTKYYDILTSLININPSYYIDLFEIYSKFSSEIKMKYPLTECLSRKNKPIYLNNLNINLDEITDIFDKVIKLKFTDDKCISLINAIELFFKSLKTNNIKNEETVCTIMIYWYISSNFNSDNTITLKNCQKSLDFSNSQFYEKLFELCNYLQFDVYPESENFEFNKRNENVWRDIFITKDNKFNLNVFSSELFEMLYDDFKSKYLEDEDEDEDEEEEEEQEEEDEEEEEEEEEEVEDEDEEERKCMSFFKKIEDRIDEMMKKIEESIQRDLISIK